MTQVQEKFEKLNSRSEMEIQFEDHFSENKEYLVRFKIIGTNSNMAPLLRVVQTEVISFLKSMSERDGSDIEPILIWMASSSIVFESI